MAEKDVEAVRPQRIPHLRQVFSQAGLTPEVENWHYDGAGTEEDPYVVEWIDDDPRNPMLYSNTKKWCLTMLVAIATLAVAFVSSAFSGGASQVVAAFGISEEIFTLGISLFVLGFAIGPLLWAPLSELFGRQILYIITYGALTAFNAGAAGSQNIQTLIVLRFMAGAWGSSPLTNAGGVIADMFPARERGLAMSLFAAAPFMGPVLGPIVGGFVGETIGWRWVSFTPRSADHSAAQWLTTCFNPDRRRHGHLHRRALDHRFSPHPRDVPTRTPPQTRSGPQQEDRQGVQVSRRRRPGPDHIRWRLQVVPAPAVDPAVSRADRRAPQHLHGHHLRNTIHVC